MAGQLMLIFTDHQVKPAKSVVAGFLLCVYLEVSTHVSIGNWYYHFCIGVLADGEDSEGEGQRQGQEEGRILLNLMKLLMTHLAHSTNGQF